MTRNNEHAFSPSPAQREAVLHGAGPCAVIAGPGSGKTHVLVERICHLLESGLARPSEILVLTFSRAAAAQMRSRFLKRIRTEPKAGAGTGVVFGTFHAVFFQILRESGGKKRRLLDARTKRRYLQHLCETLDSTPEELQHLISRYKNGLACRQNWLPDLVREYDRYLESQGCLDFDDMLLQCRDLLLRDPKILVLWRERFPWMLVDEFQDVSAVQYEILRMLAAPRDNLFIVGDDDQSIYGFRGADPRTMQRFLSDYAPSCRIVRLMTNYRCGKSILQAASSVIRDNQNRIEKQLIHGNGEEGQFAFRTFTGRADQYEYLAGELGALPREALAQSAVIFRTHAGAAAFVPVLIAHGIPFQAEQTLRRTRSCGPEVRILQDLVSYYRAAEDLAGPGALRSDLMQIMNRPERFLSGSFLQGDRMTEKGLAAHGGASRRELGELCGDLALLRTLAPAYSLRYLLNSVGYRSWAMETFSRGSDGADRIDTLLSRLCEEAEEQSNAAGWLEALQDELQALLEPGDSAGSFTDTGAPSGVRLMTMHACKGLEFDTVFLPDLNEGNVPQRRSFADDQIEEERRLLYVAMTRARRSLTLTCLEGTPDRPAAPSRFLHSLVSLTDMI